MKEEGTFPELPSYLKTSKGPILLIEAEEGRIEDLNRSMEESFGISTEHFRNELFDDCFSSERSWKEIYELILENGCYRTDPVLLKGFEQKLFLNIHPLFIGKDELFFAVHVQKPEQEAIPEAPKNLEGTSSDARNNVQVLERLDEVVYHTGISPDGNWHPIYVSPRIEEFFGIDSSEFLELSKNGGLSPFIHPEDRSKVDRAHKLLQEEKKATSLSYRITPKGKVQQKWVEEKIYPLFDQQGKHVENMGIFRDVTEQKVVERRLIQREKHFRNLFENNLAGVFRTTPDRTILSCNSAFVRMLGYDNQEELLGKRVNETYESSTDEGKFVKMVEENQGLTGHESRVTLKDGRTKYFIENVSPLWGEDGELQYIDGTIIDITELKELNLALKDSEERYRTLIDAAVDAIFVWEWESGNIVNVNRSAKELLKKEEDELLDQPLQSFFPAGKEDPLKELLHRSETASQPSLINEDSALIDAEGERIPVEVNARAFELRGEHYVVGLFRDISKWIESQKELQDSEERFRLLSQFTVEGIVMSKDGRIIDINDQFLKIFDYTRREELIGKDLKSLVPPEHQKLVQERVSGEAGNELVEAKGLRRDGSEIHVEAQGEFLPYHGEQVRVTVVHDITERKRIEEELRERERAMSTLLGNLPGIAYRCYNDPDWTMEFISQGCQEILGIAPAQLIYNRVYSYGKLIHEEDQQQVWEEVQKAIAKGERFDVQYRVKAMDGSIKTLWERGEAVGVDENTGITILEGFITDISKRVEYEERLELSQSRYRDLFENSPYGALLFKKDEVLYLNERARQFFNIESVEELHSQNVLDYVDPEHHELIRERMERVMNGEDLPFIEITGELPKEGGKIELETKLDLVEYQGEKVFYAAFRDITREKQLERQRLRAEVAEEYNKQLEKEIEEHKQTHQKLQDSQEFTRNIIDSSLDMIIAADKDGYITVFNDAAETEFGYSREEVIGLEIERLFFDRSDRQKVIEEIEEEGGFTGEIWNVDNEGNSFLSYLAATALKDHSGETIGSMGISRDITETKEAEEELRKSEEKYRAIYDQAYIGIAQVDLEGHFINANQQLCSITGYSEAEFQNMHFQDLTVPSDKAKSEDFRRKLLDGEEERVSFEKQYYHKDGSLIDLNVTVALVKDKSGDPAYFVTVFEDITERKKNEEELMRSLKEKEVLLREVHHRVKNNLQVISSILNLQSNFVEDPNTIQILRESQNRISSMSFIHESLYRTDEFDSIDMAPYIKELSRNLLHSYQQKDTHIELEHDMENVELNLDQAIPCGLIINELVSNALKYAFSGRNEGKVHIGVHCEEKEDGGEEVRLRIFDNGIGLPEGYKVGESDSLGLQLVSSLLDQLGGEISLKRDNGTEYLITFDKH